LIQLLWAFDDAQELGDDAWQFALQLPALRAAGIPDVVLRRLVAQGLIEHAGRRRGRMPASAPCSPWPTCSSVNSRAPC
jgi:hypothetical protein